LNNADEKAYPNAMTALARRIVVSRALRGFVDGLVSVLLAGYLTRLGFSPLQVGAIVTGTLLGSAALTIGLGLVAHRVPLQRVLCGSAVLMLATGIGFFGFESFWPLLVVAVLGTLNPSGGDVSAFLPAEQAALAATTSEATRAAAFARYNVAGTLAGAFGALAASVPALVALRSGLPLGAVERWGFAVYAATGAIILGIYLGVRALPDAPREPHRRPLARSRRIVLQLSALFSLDSFGGGFVVQSLLVLWLHQRFALSLATMGSVFFAAGLVGAVSQFLSPRLAARIGYIRTMVYTHLPANLFLIIAGLVPSAPWAVAFLLMRAALSQMDVPARQAYVMAVVPPDERPAAASVTNVPRSLAAAVPPLFTGMLLEWSSFGWPLVIGGALKALYDVWLLVQFRAVSGETQLRDR
jgi:MFS family permease